MGLATLEHAYGRPEEFQDFVEECHTHNIGVGRGRGHQVTLPPSTMMP